MKTKPIILLICIAISLAGVAGCGNKGKAETLKLKTCYLYDDRFPSMDEATLNQSLEEAGRAIADKFAITNISLGKIDTVDINVYFGNLLGKGFSPSNAYNPFEDNVPRRLTKEQTDFFKYYKLKDLISFLPESHRADVGDIDSYYSQLVRIWRQKAKVFMEYKVNDEHVFTKSTYHFQSCMAWKEMARRQKDYDIFITNTLIFYDDISRPYPHSICKHCKTGGSDFDSANAPNGSGHIAMASLVGFSDLRIFGEGDIAPEDMPKILGVYIIAHEVGHMVLRLPDYYDHPPHCIMNNSSSDMGYLAGYKRIMAVNKPCSKCKPFIDRRKAELFVDKK